MKKVLMGGLMVAVVFGFGSVSGAAALSDDDLNSALQASVETEPDPTFSDGLCGNLLTGSTAGCPNGWIPAAKLYNGVYCCRLRTRMDVDGEVLIAPVE